MEKFQGCNVNRHTANAGENAEVINAHSGAIEQHSRVNHGQDKSIADLTRRMRINEASTESWRRGIASHADMLTEHGRRLRDVEKLVEAVDDACAVRGMLTGADLDCRLKDCEHLLRAHTDNHATAQVFSFTDVKCEAPGHMTADEAADIILAEQDKLLAEVGDENLRVWIRGMVALLTGGLREHAREDR